MSPPTSARRSVKRVETSVTTLVLEDATAADSDAGGVATVVSRAVTGLAPAIEFASFGSLAADGLDASSPGIEPSPGFGVFARQNIIPPRPQPCPDIQRRARAGTAQNA
ncbi:MAG: hypothetical protein K2X41_12130, partial [Hyphomicrobium sp.]|nr:hypothetical protein [Hyphomicrobium sp.]